MRAWFDGAQAILDAWDAFTLYDISTGDHMDTDEILLEEYTYQGTTVRGMEPRPYR